MRSVRCEVSVRENEQNSIQQPLSRRNESSEGRSIELMVIETTLQFKNSFLFLVKSIMNTNMIRSYIA